MKRTVTLLLAVLMLTVLAGYQTTEAATTGTSGGCEKKVALLLPGTVNDKGWSKEAYDGLMEIKKLGCEVAYSEAVATSDFETVFRGYADQGYDIIFGHGSQFSDAAKTVAPDYPETMFLITSSNVVQEPNVASVQNLNDQQGFLSGVVAALATKTGKVGAIGGVEIPPIQSFIIGFKAGVAYVNNGTVALTAFTGNFDDAAKLKEQAVAFIEQGADIITADANQAGLGIFEAIKGHKGVYAIGSVQDQYAENPAQTITSSTNRISLGMVAAVKQALSGTLTPKVYKFGVAEGVIGLAPFRDHEDVLTDKQKQFLAETMKKVAAGEIEIKSAQAK